jgi:hypothetical protein
MSLWGTTDANTSAPKFAVAGGLGVAANGNVAFGNVTVGAFKTGAALGVFGVSAAEAANAVKEGANTTHAGWVLRTQGTGYVAGIEILSGGAGYTPGTGFITFANGGSGVGANATYTANAAGNISSIVMNYVGNTYNTTPTANIVAGYSVQASLRVIPGGRLGRITYQTLVASGNIATDAGADDAIMGV